MTAAILAIDPGTHCGWAVRTAAGVPAFGVWDLGIKRHESPGMRFLRLRTQLNTVRDAFSVRLVAYEEVRRHAGVSAAHIYGGIVATVQAWCAEHGVEHVGIPVATIKRKATGKGNADKVAMVAAARRAWPEVMLDEDDNLADALWIAETAWADVGAMLGTAP